MAKAPKRPAGLLDDVRGGVRLVIDGVEGVTGMVETLHHRIARRSPPLGIVPDAPTRGISPYLAPFTRLSGLRSEGITDLRHGNLLEQDWVDSRFEQRDTRTLVPLPHGVACCYAVAGSLGQGRSETGEDGANPPDPSSAAARTLSDAWLGDGLVPLASALGRHAKPTRELHIPPSRVWVGRGINHLDLLSSKAVYQRLRRWLAG